MTAGKQNSISKKADGASVGQSGDAEKLHAVAGSSKVSSSNIDVIEKDVSLVAGAQISTVETTLTDTVTSNIDAVENDAAIGAGVHDNSIDATITDTRQQSNQMDMGVRGQKDFEQLICIEIFFWIGPTYCCNPEDWNESSGD